MASFDWWRSHHGAPTDTKWLAIAKRAGVAPGMVSAVAWALLDHASQSDERGDVSAFDVETYAAFSGFDEAQISAVILAMADKGVIVEGRFSAWDRRQSKREDDSAERTREWRARKRQDEATAPQSPPQSPPQERVSAQICETQQANNPETPDGSMPQACISPAASCIADEVAAIAGHDISFVPPSWCGAALRVQMWLNRGWSSALIIESVRAQMARRASTGPPASIQYFEGGIRDAHVASSRPIRDGPVRVRSKKTIMGVIDGMLDDIKGGGGRGGESPSRLLPDR